MDSDKTESETKTVTCPPKRGLHSEIVEALGLTVCGVYDTPPADYFAPTHSRIPMRDLVEVIDPEVLAIAVLANDLAQIRLISEATRTTLTIAAARIGRARNHANGNRRAHRTAKYYSNREVRGP
jgi:hypothetical protein